MPFLLRGQIQQEWRIANVQKRTKYSQAQQPNRCKTGKDSSTLWTSILRIAIQRKLDENRKESKNQWRSWWLKGTELDIIEKINLNNWNPIKKNIYKIMIYQKIPQLANHFYKNSPLLQPISKVRTAKV